MCEREVTAALGKVGRLLLFICHLVNQENDSQNDRTKLKQIVPCNEHICHPLSLWIGGNKEEILPPKEIKKKSKGGTVYRGAGSTTNNVAQNPINCKENIIKKGHVAEKCDVPCFYLGVGMKCRGVPFIQPLCPGSGAGRLIAALRTLKNFFTFICHNLPPLCVL